MCCPDLQQITLHPHSQALGEPAGRAHLGYLGHLTLAQPCPAHYLCLLHPLQCSPEESSAGIAAVTCTNKQITKMLSF